MPRHPVRGRHLRVLVPRIAALLVGALALNTAAEAQKVGTRYERDADFTGLETFAWRLNTKKPETSPLVPGGELDELIRGILTEELERRGYRPAEGADADFEVAYDGFLETVVDDLALRKDVTPGVAWVVEGDYRSWEQGSLYIWVHLPGRERAAWTAWASGRRTDQDGPDPRKIRRAARRMLARFPPR